MTLWLAAAGLVVVAAGLVLVAGRGDDDESTSLPTLPIGAGAAMSDAGEAADASAIAPRADMTLLPGVTYVPGDGLPALGGEAPAYRLGGEDAAVDAEDVTRLAEALGIEGEPAETDGTWHVDDGERALDVYGTEGSWSTYAIAPTSSSGAGTTPEAEAEARTEAGDDGAAGVDSGVAQVAPDELTRLCPTDQTNDPRATDAPATGDGSSGSAGNAAGPVVDPEIPEILPCEPPVGDPVPLPMPTEPFEPPVRPADLPSEDEAESIAVDLLGAVGADTDDAKVTVEDGITEWFVTVEPRIGGLPAPGLSMYVGVGSEGTITMASGYLADPEELGDYPLLDTTKALERLNEQFSGVMTAVDPAAADVAVGAAEPAVDPATPATEPGIITTEPVPPPRDRGEDLPVLTEPLETALPPDTAVPETTIVEPRDPATTIPDEPGLPAPSPTTPPVPAPPKVEVTDAELVLLTEVAWDGSGTYLVPGYRFTAEDQSSPVVTAVVDNLVEPPPAVSPDDPAVDGGPGDGDLPVSIEPGVEPPPVAPDTPVDLPAEAPDPRPAVLPADADAGDG